MSETHAHTRDIKQQNRSNYNVGISLNDIEQFYFVSTNRERERERKEREKRERERERVRTRTAYNTYYGCRCISFECVAFRVQFLFLFIGWQPT